MGWLAQPLYVVIEVGAALATGVGYSLRDDTISQLGTACAGGSSSGCSSAPWVLNAALVLFGLLQAAGAVTLLRPRPASTRHRRARLVALLWVVAGVSSVGVGLLPLDQHPTAHSLVALPVFLCQPLALLLHGHLVEGRWRATGVVLGTASVVGAVAFGVLLGADHGSGAVERLAVWPAKAWLALVVLRYAAAPDPPEAPAAA
jgi:hypothetical membrane protein